MKTIQMDQAGRVVLPKPVREMLRLVPGDSLKVTVDNGGIRLEPMQSGSGLTRKGSVLVVSGSLPKPVTNQSINELINRDRDERIAEVSGAGGRR